MTSTRLLQLLHYAEALAVMAEHGRGNVEDTRDIVKALQELQAYYEFIPNVKPMPKRVSSPPPRPRKTA